MEVVAAGLPPGLGSHVHWDRKLDGALGAALLSIQAAKGLEIGDAFLGARRRGSQVHDEIGWSPERGYFRYSNRAGGLEGGMTNGMDLVVRVAFKPIATLYGPCARWRSTRTPRPWRASNGPTSAPCRPRR